MTPFAASLLGYVLGLVTALFIGAIVMILRGGGGELRAHDFGSLKRYRDGSTRDVGQRR